MADNQEINTSPTLVGRVVEGVKEGIVGAALGAAAGYVTGVALDGLDITSSVADVKEVAQTTIKDNVGNLIDNTAKITNSVLSPTNAASVANGVGQLMTGDPDALLNTFKQGVETIRDLKPFDLAETAKAIQTSDFINNLGDSTKAFVDNSFKNQVDLLTDPSTLAAAGAVAGGTYKGLGGLVSSQSDKRQDIENGILEQRVTGQQQQIQGVAQLAGMALAASASANEGLKVIGEHTGRLLQGQQQLQQQHQHLVQTASHVNRVEQQRAVDPTTNPSLA